MKTIIMLLLLIMSFPSYAFSGEIYGVIKVGNRHVGEGVRVTIGDYSTNTDTYGIYSLYVPGEGRRTLRVRYNNDEPSIEIYSYEGSVRYNLVLVERTNGGYSLGVE